MAITNEFLCTCGYISQRILHHNVTLFAHAFILFGTSFIFSLFVFSVFALHLLRQDDHYAAARGLV